MSADNGYREGVETDDASQARHHSLVGLHGMADALNGVRPGDLPGLRPSSPSTMLRNVSEASLDEIPISARVGVLFDLAKADFPHYESHEQEYHDLVASVADARGISVDQLFSDL